MHDTFRIERGPLPGRRPPLGRRVGSKREHTAGTLVLKKEIRGKGHPITRAPAKQIHHRPARRLAHDVIARDFKRTEHVNPLSLVPRSRATLVAESDRCDLGEDLIQLERVMPDYALGGLSQGGKDLLAAWNLAPARDAVTGHYLDNDSQRVGCMQSDGVQERRVG